MQWIQDKANCSAWLIFRNDGVLIGKVQALYTASAVRVQVWDWSKPEPVQNGKASGCGYDKFTAALAGCTVDGITLTDHCSKDSRTSAILEAYTREIIKAQKAGADKDQQYKIEKKWRNKAEKYGSHFANYTEHNAKNLTSWQAENFERRRKGNVWRYTDLYLESGLKRLEMLGYKVYQAI